MKNLKTKFALIFVATMMMACQPARITTTPRNGTHTGGVSVGSTDSDASDNNNPLLPTFDSIKTNILEAKCLSCHAEGGRAEDVPLAKREDLSDPQAGLVVPGRPDQSLLVKVIKGPKVQMPPQRSGLKPLSDKEVAVIEEWIQNGARD
jgi:hypothetical protein